MGLDTSYIASNLKRYNLYPDPVPRSDLAKKWLGNYLMWPHLDSHAGIGGNHRQIVAQPALAQPQPQFDDTIGVKFVRPQSAASTREHYTIPSKVHFQNHLQRQQTNFFEELSVEETVLKQRLPTMSVSTPEIASSGNIVRVAAAGNLPFSLTKTHLTIHKVAHERKKKQHAWSKHVENKFTTFRSTVHTQRPRSAIPNRKPKMESKTNKNTIESKRHSSKRGNRAERKNAHPNQKYVLLATKELQRDQEADSQDSVKQMQRKLSPAICTQRKRGKE